MSLKQKNVVKKAKGALQKPQRAKHGTQSADKSAKNKPSKVAGLNADTSIPVIARLEAQIAALEEQIALLRSDQLSVGSDQYSADHSSLTTDYCPLTTAKPSGQYAANSTPTTAKQLTTDHCPLTTAMPLATDSETRAKLTTPTLDSVIVVGSQFLRLNWSPVSDATGYLVQSSTGTSFVNNLVSRTVDAPGTSMTLTGLQPDTTYYVRVQALAGAGNSDSDFSVAKSAKTGIADGDDAASYLQGWLDNLNSEFDRVALLVPQLETTVLDAKERLRLNGSGVRRLGHIKKVLEVSLEFPQFWPAFAGDNNMDEQVREIDVLRNLLIETQYYSRVIGDLLLLADHAAFRSANTYYTTVRDAARRDIPEAKQVFNKLKLFWRRPRRTTDVPTEQEVERDLHALEHGTADGSLYVENESDHVTKGKKTVIDNVVPKQRRAAARFEEQEEIE